MVSTHFLISKSSSVCTIWWLHRAPYLQQALSSFSRSIVCLFFQFSCKIKYLSLFRLSFSFTLGSAVKANSTVLQVLFFLFTIIRMDSVMCIYHLFIWSNLNFLHNSQCIIFSTQPCLVLYSFGAKRPYSLIMWLIVSSLLPYNLHQLFLVCWVLWHINLSRLFNAKSIFM